MTPSITKTCAAPIAAMDLPAAPPAAMFPAAPASWYFICRSRELTSTPLGSEVLGTRVVAFRNAQSQPSVLAAHCAHMGADLSRGRIVGGRLQCPFHGWIYAADGRCVGVPGQSSPPSFARQPTYVPAERHGLLFAFAEGEPLFNLPEFFEPTATALTPGRPARYIMACPWYMFGGNGFDLQHFAHVHDREILDEPRIDRPEPFARRIRFTSRVAGNSLADRLVRRFVGPVAQVSITVWAGNLIAVSARFGRTASRLMFATAPLGADRTLADLIVFAERGPQWRRWALPLSLWIRRTLTLAFIGNDVARVGRAAYRPGTLIEADRAMIDYYRWLAALPPSRKECP